MTGEMIRHSAEEARFVNNPVAVNGRARCYFAKIALDLFAILLVCWKAGCWINYLTIFPVGIDDSEGIISNVTI